MAATAARTAAESTCRLIRSFGLNVVVGLPLPLWCGGHGQLRSAATAAAAAAAAALVLVLVLLKNRMDLKWPMRPD